MIDIKSVLEKLVSFESITPYDHGCQAYLTELLTELGFTCEAMDNEPVSNLYAQIGEGTPLVVFAGHTDVVPVGHEQAWDTDPFVLTEKDGLLYGRGTADMKGSLAAMLKAAEQLLIEKPHFAGSLGFLITSGEEGDDFDKGTPHVMQVLHERGITPKYCIVGEPSSVDKLGDTIKIGRRGSLTGKFIFAGKQGHVAYPHLANNPIHMVAQALDTLVQYQFDTGNEYFPPTSLQITHIESGGEANNVIPGELTLQLNIRFSTEQTAKGLMKHIDEHFTIHNLNPETHWRINGEPFLTQPGTLIDATVVSIEKHMGYKPQLSTSGGTSDARFIAPYDVEVIELGPRHESIHQVNEHTSLDDLEKLCDIYLDIASRLL